MAGLDLSRFRVGLAGAHKRAVEKRAACDLANGDLYLFPTEGSNLTSSADVTFKWNPTCLPTTTSIDLYLYTSSQGLLHSFPGVEYAKGEYNAGQFDPAWWNYTTKASVYLSIVDANQPRFLSDIPLGPTFSLFTAKEQLSTTIVQGGTTIVTAASAVIASSKAAAKATATASVNGTAAGAASDDPGMFSSALAPPGGLSKAVMAVAIVVPIVVVALLVGLYVKFARLREQEKRKRWSEHVDRRMSVISADWRQGAPRGSVVSGAGARPMSMARSSMVSSGGAARPVSAWTRDSSVYAVENNIAGRGAVGYRPHPSGRPHSVAGGRPQSTLSNDRPASQRPQSIFTVSHSDLATLPAGVRNSHVSFAGAGAPGTRQSRVSFGDTLIRPSKSSLSVNVIPGNTAAQHNKRMSRAEPSPTAGRHSIDGALVSPSQADGPFAVPSVPLPSRSGSASGGGVSGFFASITSAVGKRDKSKPAETEEDRRQAEATRRSADGLRDAESILLRRSQAISQYSQRSNNAAGGPLPSPSVYEEPEDRVEELTNAASPPTQMGVMGMPLPGPTANPDQLLAAYAAARAGAKSPVEDTYADDK